MIKVDRSRVPMPECLRTDIDSAGKLETQAAKRFFQRRMRARLAAAKKSHVADEKAKAKKTKKRKSFEFKVYKQAKPALEELFNNKCGYCEIDYGGAPSDVEHFRPKGEIDYEHEGRTGKHPEGYYWLAADWNNLIYSCQHCNRGETHDHQEQAEASVVRRVSGKANYFPLDDESMRLKPCNRVDEEEPFRLLLDPCRDEPLEHLYFHRDGFVTAKVNSGRPSPQGSTSIRFYGLSRVALIDRRKHTAATLMFAIERLNEDLAQMHAQPASMHRQRAIATLKHINTEFLEENRPFLGMAWALFRQYVNDRDLSSLAHSTSTPAPAESEH